MRVEHAMDDAGLCRFCAKRWPWSDLSCVERREHEARRATNVRPRQYHPDADTFRSETSVPLRVRSIGLMLGSMW